MALPNPIPAVQGARIVLGPAIWEDTYLIVPGTSDYVTGGYVITALSLRCYSVNGIMCAWVSGQNSTAAGYVPQVTLALAQIGATSTGAGFEGYAQLKFQVFLTGTASGDVLNEAGSGANLTGCVWLLTVRGQ
jgi:hypothetical protein